MEQHPVPQHIASFEFKLFGNLTIRQFVTLAIPMSMALLLYFSTLTDVVRIPLSIAIALFAFFAALVPIQGRPLDRWIVAFIKAILAPTQRVWVKETKIPEFLIIVTTPPPIKERPNEAIITLSREKLHDYLRSLPMQNLSPLDVKEQVALERLAFEPGAKGKHEGRLPPAIAWAPVPTTPVIQPTAGQEYEFGLQQALPQAQIAQTPISQIAPHAKPFALPGLEKKLRTKKTEKEPVELVSYLTEGKPLETEIPTRHLASEINYSQEFVIPLRTPDNQLTLVPAVGSTRVRKLHFGPPLGFDISKLPIRGERRFEISEELKKRFHFEDEIPEGQPPPVVLPIERPKPAVQAQPSVQKQPKPEVGPQLKKARLVLKPNIITAPQDVAFKTQKKETQDSRISTRGQKLKVGVPTQLSRAQMLPLTNKPNVLSGLITTKDGTPLEGAIFIVRDVNGIPVRALKTNKLGQLLSATSLANGQYQVEIEANSAKFDPFTINLNGQVVAPLEIKAKE